MTKIDIIKEVIEANHKKVLKLDAKRVKVDKTRNDEFTKMFKKYFGECLTRPDLEESIEVNNNRCYFQRFDPEAKYHRELMNVTIRYKNWKEEVGDEIQTSFYTTSENSEFELSRMVMIGNVAQIILDFQDDILAEFNSINSSYKDELSILNKQIWDLEKIIRDMKSEINSIEDRNLMKRVEKEGIEFEVDESKIHRLPSLDVRWDYTKENIKKIKVIDKTKSGKSANIELTTLSKVWDGETGGYHIKEYLATFSNVRMDKIENLVTWNKEKILENTSTLVEA